MNYVLSERNWDAVFNTGEELNSALKQAIGTQTAINEAMGKLVRT